LGRAAEELASKYLEHIGFKVLGRNVRLGRLELDVIAERGSLVVFCEVRSRRRDTVMTPAQSIDPRKVLNVRRAASAWLAAAPRRYAEVRFDVALVTFDQPGGRLNYLEGAF
jgi:putative endonuclease